LIPFLFSVKTALKKDKKVIVYTYVKNGGNEKIEGNLNPVLVVRTGN
jgi:hypothetical protein